MKEGFISSSFLIIFRLHVNDKEVISLSSTNLLLQVTRLENTKFVYLLNTDKSNYRFGAVIYTGHETKFGMNKAKPILKLAVSDRMTSVFTVIVLCLQVDFCLF